jgi:hypothetical protein
MNIIRPPSEASEPGSLETFVQAADLGSDDAFRQVLADEKQVMAHLGPADLRAALTARNILRMSIGQGFHHSEGRHQLVWWFSEIGLEGSERDVDDHLQSFFRDRGFRSSEPNGQWTSRYLSGDGDPASAASGHLLTEVLIEGPRRWRGGRQRAAGISLAWTVTAGSTSVPPRLAQVVEALPMLKDPRIDASVYEALAGKPVIDLMFSGTWTRYYSTSITFLPDVSGEDTALTKEVTQVLGDAGFQLKEENGDKASFERQRDGDHAHAQLSIAKGTAGGVHLHIQPQS